MRTQVLTVVSKTNCPAAGQCCRIEDPGHQALTWCPNGASFSTHSCWRGGNTDLNARVRPQQGEERCDGAPALLCSCSVCLAPATMTPAQSLIVYGGISVSLTPAVAKYRGTACTIAASSCLAVGETVIFLTAPFHARLLKHLLTVEGGTAE